MGLLGDILGKAFDATKVLISNARVGKEAIAAGFTTSVVPAQSKQAAAQNAVGPFGLTTTQIVGGFVALVLFFFFNRKR